MSDEKKERVIHTRVPESLETELRKRAEDLGMSVSNLVRNVIGHAFGLVGDVAADSHAIARAARGEPGGVRSEAGGRDGDTRRDATPGAPRARRGPANAEAGDDAPDLDDVIAWQPIVLAKNAVCARCNDLLPRGKDGAIAVGGTARDIICAKCLGDVRA